jgi:hypothetical protein
MKNLVMLWHFLIFPRLSLDICADASFKWNTFLPLASTCPLTTYDCLLIFLHQTSFIAVLLNVTISEESICGCLPVTAITFRDTNLKVR